MTNYALLTEYMFAVLVDLKAGRNVYVVARRESREGDIEIEEVIVCKSSSPQAALEAHCKAMGLETANRLAIPVLLPLGLKQEDAKGFISVRNGASLRIEFTQ